MAGTVNLQGVPDFNKLKILKQAVLVIPGQSSPSANTHYALSASITHNYKFAPSYFVFAYMPMVDWYGTQLYNQIIQFPQGIQENSTTAGNGNFYYLGALADKTTFTLYNNAYTHSTPTDIPAMPCYYTLFETLTH